MTAETPAAAAVPEVLHDLLCRVRVLGVAATVAPDAGLPPTLITEIEPAARAAAHALAQWAPEALTALRRAVDSARTGRFADSHTELLVAHGHLTAALRGCARR
ncbi:hypothetical protein [Amycolatopsis australiensis]|uniref:hypothetical protein n=1 Tax=Amycolatopsis australiensis TaxID=546364 RepID=UPI0009303BB6|nr:hypothetical protein [Amycolatopsis australiensis]